MFRAMQQPQQPQGQMQTPFSIPPQMLQQLGMQTVPPELHQKVNGMLAGKTPEQQKQVVMNLMSEMGVNPAQLLQQYGFNPQQFGL